MKVILLALLLIIAKTYLTHSWNHSPGTARNHTAGCGCGGNGLGILPRRRPSWHALHTLHDMAVARYCSHPLHLEDEPTLAEWGAVQGEIGEMGEKSRSVIRCIFSVVLDLFTGTLILIHWQYVMMMIMMMIIVWTAVNLVKLWGAVQVVESERDIFDHHIIGLIKV